MANKSEESKSSRRPNGLSRGVKNGARLLVVAGLAMLLTGLFANVASASVTQPTLNSSKATFAIKAGSSATWRLSLWEILSSGTQKLVGRDSGTSGMLVVKVPQTSNCYFQVDVMRDTKYYAGFKKAVPFCGGTSVSGSTTTTTTHTTPTTTKTPPTTSKPKTSGGGGTTPTTTAPGSSSSSGSSPGTTTVPSSQLAFTGVGTMMWITAILGLLLAVAGSSLLLYARRFARG